MLLVSMAAVPCNICSKNTNNTYFAQCNKCDKCKCVNLTTISLNISQKDLQNSKGKSGYDDFRENPK